VLTDTSSDDKLIGVFVSKSDKSFGHIACIFDKYGENIKVYDENLQLKFIFRGINVKKMIQVDNTYYCMLDDWSGPHPDIKKKDSEYKRVTGNLPIIIVHGMYMLNLQRMISDGELEIYQISKAVVIIKPNLKYC